MGKKFVGLDGLKHFWSKAKSWIAEQITAEVTAKIAQIIAKAPEDLDTLKEIADWIKNHANDAAAMNTAILANKTAISGKADKSHTHTKSQITDFPTSLPANGGTADKTVNDITIDIPYVTESGQYVIPLGNILEPTSTEIDSPYNWDITGFFSIIRPSGHAGFHITFEAGHGYAHSFTTYAYLDETYFPSYDAVHASIKAFQYNGKWWLGLYIKTTWQGYYGKMTVTYSRGLPAKPTCVLYNSVSNGVTNEEIYNSIQDIPSSWWRQRTICNPTSFSDTLYANGVIEPRLGTYDGSIVSIGRDDGNIVIGDTSNNNRGNTVINNDCKMRHDLGVFGESNFVGPCYFNENIFVHNKSLFPSGYIPRTYFIERATKDNITAEQKELLRKMFAYQSVNRLIQCHGLLLYRFNTSGEYFGGTIVTIGYFDGDDWLDINDNIRYDDNSCVNFACFGVQDDDENINIVDMYYLSEYVMRNKFEKLNYLLVSRLYFTVLEKV